MKIVLIGAGSYVFAPAVLHDAIVDHQLSGSELVLVDLDASVADLMRDFGQKMAQDVGVDIHIRSTADRLSALPDADFVISSAAVEGARRWQMDAEILQKHGLQDQLAENGCLTGITYACRTISLALDIASDMEKHCPDAMFLDCANPMPRVVSAINRFSPISAIGFCNAAWGGPNGFAQVANWLGRDLDSIEVVSGGINHFAWLLSVRDSDTGENLYPQLEERIRQGEVGQAGLHDRLLEEYGGIGLAGSHMIEFIPWNPGEPRRHAPPFHGNPEEREAHLQRIRQAANGDIPWIEILEAQRSWERPVDVAVALHTGAEAAFDMVNIPNRRYIPELIDGTTVEVPATTRSGRLTGISVPALPAGVAEICRQVAEVNELVAEAAATGNTALARQAIDVDPAIPQKAKAQDALTEMLAAHADVLPRFVGTLPS